MMKENMLDYSAKRTLQTIKIIYLKITRNGQVKEAMLMKFGNHNI